MAWDSLTSVADRIYIGGNPLLTAVHLDNLTGSVVRVSVAGCPALAGLTMNSLQTITQELRVINNQALSDFEFASLAAIGGTLKVETCPLLPTCQIDALLLQLQAAGGVPAVVDVTGTDSNVSCP